MNKKIAVRTAAGAMLASAGVLMTSGVAMAAPTYPPATPTASVLGESFTNTPANPAPANPVIPVAVKPAQSALPFTGFNAATFAVVGAALIGGGTAFTVVARRRRVEH